MKNQLDGLRWMPCWTSHMGCLAGCLEFAGMQVSPPRLFGGTGHAFIINIHDELCPSGPTAWDTSMLFRLGENLGYGVRTILAEKAQADFAGKQREAWLHVRECIERRVPCYGWELSVPEFYTIHGCDDTGYYYTGPCCADESGPRPWQELGTSGTSVLCVHSVRAGAAAPAATQVREAFAFAVEHALTGRWAFPNYSAGADAYEAWAAALEAGRASRFGQGYNCAVWSECRDMAVLFLREVREEMPGKTARLFDEAVLHYRIVQARLRSLLELYPFRLPEAEGERLKSVQGAELVRQAAASERKGLEVLRRIAESL